MVEFCKGLGGFLVIDDLFAAAFDGIIRAFPAFEDDTLVSSARIDGEHGCHHRFVALFQHMFDDIAVLAHADAGERAMRYHQWWDGQAATIGAAALPEAH